MNHVNLEELQLAHGSHKRRDDGMCVMEAVAWFAGQPHSDQPPCASPVIAQFAMGLNDNWDNHERQQLVPLIPLIVNTRDDNDQIRGLMAADWLIRTYTPAWLRLAGLTKEADVIAGLPEITDWSMLAEAMKPLEAAKRSAAAAWAAAGAAARAAARAAAGAAAGDVLQPTVDELRASALELLRRMCMVGKEAA